MKLWVLSDIHTEFEDYWPVDVPDADVAVVAGDVAVGTVKALDWVRDNVALHMPAVVVFGNHEFYGGQVEDRIAEAREHAARLDEVHFLEDDAVVLGGVRFVGATLWTDFTMGAQTTADIAWNMRSAEGLMQDYGSIRGLRSRPFQRPFPFDTAKMHAASRDTISRWLDIPFDGPTVVVTHHAPHPLSVADRFVGSSMNAAFVSDLSDVIERWQPSLWVHGHVHDSFDYRVSGTRVVANPRGYPGENPAWNPGLVVEA